MLPSVRQKKYNDVTMKWLVEQTQNSEEISARLRERNADLVPIKKFGYTEEDFKIPDESFIGHGSIGFAKAVKKGFMFDEEAFKCSSYYKHYQDWMLIGDEYIIVKAKNLPKLKHTLFRDFGQDGCVFVKPDTNDKIFNGQVVELERFDRSALGIVANNQDAEVVISRPWNIAYEWRLFVADGDVVAGSQFEVPPPQGWGILVSSTLHLCFSAKQKRHEP